MDNNNRIKSKLDNITSRITINRISILKNKIEFLKKKKLI